MAYLAVDKYGAEAIYDARPERGVAIWSPMKRPNGSQRPYVELPKGSIAKLIGRELTWSDEPVMIE